MKRLFFYLIKFFGYMLYVVFIVAVLSEIVLRILDPFGFRQKDNEVVLPRNRTMIFTNTKIPVLESSSGYNGELVWKLLELYNNKTREIANDKNLLVIDLAKELPKCSLYFYDFCHFTKEGSEKVADILSERLITYLKPGTGKN